MKTKDTYDEEESYYFITFADEIKVSPKVLDKTFKEKEIEGPQAWSLHDSNNPKLQVVSVSTMSIEENWFGCWHGYIHEHKNFETENDFEQWVEEQKQ